MTDPVTDCLTDDVQTEFALGALTGRTRADAVAHVLVCPRCRDQVEGLVETSEQILLAAPQSEPPAGFETNVLERLRVGNTRPRPRIRLAVSVVAAVLAIVAAFGGGAMLARGSGHGGVAEATMVTPSGRDVGSAWRYRGDPSLIVVSVPGWQIWDEDADLPREYRLRVGIDDGDQLDLGPVFLSPETGTWATTTVVDAGQFRSVAIVDDAGRIWCQGRF